MMVQRSVWKGLYKTTRDVAKNTYFQILSTKSLGVEAWELAFLQVSQVILIISDRIQNQGPVLPETYSVSILIF